MSEESKFFGVTIRGWIALEIVTFVCLMSILKVDVKEPLYSLVVLAVGFYFGSKSPMVMKNDTGRSGQDTTETPK